MQLQFGEDFLCVNGVFVRLVGTDPPNTSVAASVQQTTNVVAASTPPPAVMAQQQDSSTGSRENSDENVAKRNIYDSNVSQGEPLKRKRAPKKEMSKHDN